MLPSKAQMAVPDLPSNRSGQKFSTSSSKLRWRLHDLKGSQDFFCCFTRSAERSRVFREFHELFALGGGWRNWPRCSKSNQLSLKIKNGISMNEISPKRPEKNEDKKILRATLHGKPLHSPSPLARGLLFWDWWTPMVQIHEMSEQIRIEWLQFHHRTRTCRLTSCPHVMFQRASPSVPVPPDVWKALWSLKPPAMSNRRLGSRPTGVRKVIKPFTQVEVLAAIFRVTKE